MLGMFLGNSIGGVSIGWWKATHNVHHIVTNHVRHGNSIFTSNSLIDCDIQHLPFIACSPLFFQDIYSTYHNRVMEFSKDVIAKVMVPIQHCTFYVVLFFGRFNLYIQSLIYLTSGVQSKQAMHKWDHYELALLGVFWTWYITLLSHLPDAATVAAYVALSNGMAFILHIQV
jgi:delta8-fatty-acid desaturase